MDRCQFAIHGLLEVEIMQFEQEDAMSRVHHVLGLGCARALCRSGLIFVLYTEKN